MGSLDTKAFRRAQYIIAATEQGQSLNIRSRLIIRLFI
jgi:hypothetical protein